MDDTCQSTYIAQGLIFNGFVESEFVSSKIMFAQMSVVYGTQVVEVKLVPLFDCWFDKKEMCLTKMHKIVLTMFF